MNVDIELKVGILRSLLKPQISRTVPDKINKFKTYNVFSNKVYAGKCKLRSGNAISFPKNIQYH